MNRLYIGLGIAGVGIAGYWYWDTYLRDNESSGSDTDGKASDMKETAETKREGLARMLASEAPAPKYTVAERVAILWCAMNYAAKRKRTITSIMLPPHHQKGYWCSTYNSPKKSDTDLVDQFLKGVYGVDSTNGATSFFEPAVQDAAYNKGISGYRFNAAMLREKWSKEGLVLKATVGRWEFWGRK